MIKLILTPLGQVCVESDLCLAVPFTIMSSGRSEVGPRGQNLPNTKCPQCLICSLMAAVCKFVAAHSQKNPFLKPLLICMREQIAQ